jgi:hypothetical protein
MRCDFAHRSLATFHGFGGVLGTNTHIFQEAVDSVRQSGVGGKGLWRGRWRTFNYPNNPSGDTKVIDDLENHLIIRLFINTLKELEPNKGNNAYINMKLKVC